MGTDKALLQVGGQMLIERVVTALRAVAGEVLLVGRDAGRFDWLGVQTLEDVFVGGGPLAGIHAALSSARHPRCLVVACDMPFLNIDLLRYMLRQADGWDAVVPRWQERLQPLHAVYTPTCLGPIEGMLSAGDRCPLDLYPRLHTRFVTGAEIAALEEGWLSFVNLNTPDDLILAPKLASLGDWEVTAYPLAGLGVIQGDNLPVTC